MVIFLDAEQVERLMDKKVDQKPTTVIVRQSLQQVS